MSPGTIALILIRSAIRKYPRGEPCRNRSGLISCRDERRRYLLAGASYPLGTATRCSPRVDTCRRDTDRAPAVDDRVRVVAHRCRTASTHPALPELGLEHCVLAFSPRGTHDELTTTDLLALEPAVGSRGRSSRAHCFGLRRPRASDRHRSRNSHRKRDRIRTVGRAGVRCRLTTRRRHQPRRPVCDHGRAGRTRHGPHAKARLCAGTNDPDACPERYRDGGLQGLGRRAGARRGRRHRYAGRDREKGARQRRVDGENGRHSCRRARAKYRRGPAGANRRRQRHEPVGRCRNGEQHPYSRLQLALGELQPRCLHRRHPHERVRAAVVRQHGSQRAGDVGDGRGRP